MNEAISRELLAMAAEDFRIRQELSADGSLWSGYHPRMEEVHVRNARRLEEIMTQHGWPGRSLVGEQAAEAAWMILQHAIGNPPLQRRGLELLQQAAATSEIPAWQPAYLEDRIRMYEGRPQLYGTQFMPDEDGQPAPVEVDDLQLVDERRRRVGLRPLTEHVRLMREQAAREQPCPKHRDPECERKYLAWLYRVGWRTRPPA